MIIFNQRFIHGFFLLACLMILFSGCVAPFSELQSAKLLGPGKIETTAHFSSVSLSSEGESSHVQNSFGIQSAVGVHMLMDFRLRYEHVGLDPDFGDISGVNVLGFGPKFSLVKDWVAIYFPVGFAFGNDIEVSDTWQIHPTVLFTVPVNKYVEFNPSAKVLIPFKSEQDTMVAFNLGAGISTDINKWAIRPEIGFLYNPGESGYFMHFSLGFSIYPRWIVWND